MQEICAFYAKHVQTLNMGSVYGQTVRWCDEGAYLLANQLLDKFQSKEGAQAALHDIERLVEMAPSVVWSNRDVLSLEFEAMLTPQLQVRLWNKAQIHWLRQVMESIYLAFF